MRILPKKTSLIPIGKESTSVSAQGANGIVALFGEIFHIHGHHKGPVTSVALSADGDLLANGSFLGTLHIWDAHTGRSQFTIEGEDEYINFTSVALSASGDILASAGNDRIVRVWDWRNGRRPKFEFGGHT